MTIYIYIYIYIMVWERPLTAGINWGFWVAYNLPTPNSTLTLSSHLEQNCDLGHDGSGVITYPATFVYGILNPANFCWWIQGFRIRKPANDWNPESKFHRLGIQNPVPGIRIHCATSSPGSCRFPIRRRLERRPWHTAESRDRRPKLNMWAHF